MPRASVDTTLCGAAKQLIAAAQAGGAPIKRIALTRGHRDHAGSVDGLGAGSRSRPRSTETFERLIDVLDRGPQV
jgi:glyoxylase-like metal-dependent hydrolase (beta-lactamase superfamily II)